MRFATVTTKNEHEPFVALVEQQLKYLLPLQKAGQRKYGKNIFPATLLDCITQGDAFIQRVEELLGWIHTNGLEGELFQSLEDVDLLAPIPRPAKNIFCVGKNYAEHAIEMGSSADIPKHLMVFTKAPTTVIGQNETVLYDQEVTKELDYEGELAVIIGKKGKNIRKEDAFQHVFGYTVMNDITARDLQRRHKQFFLGKSLDTTCPIGPWIVHHSVLPDPHSLHIETKVNGEIRQKACTDQFIFPIDEIIAVLSKGMTLEPGDIIATGTPAGVGKGYQPPKFLQQGDVMEVTIEQIGTLRNQVHSV